MELNFKVTLTALSTMPGNESRDRLNLKDIGNAVLHQTGIVRLMKWYKIESNGIRSIDSSCLTHRLWVTVLLGCKVRKVRSSVNCAIVNTIRPADRERSQPLPNAYCIIRSSIRSHWSDWTQIRMRKWGILIVSNSKAANFFICFILKCEPLFETCPTL